MSETGTSFTVVREVKDWVGFPLLIYHYSTNQVLYSLNI